MGPLLLGVAITLVAAPSTHEITPLIERMQPGRGTRTPVTHRGRMITVTATLLDGKATLAAIKAEAQDRVAAPARRPRRRASLQEPSWSATTPPGSWYVRAKHRDCQEIGIASIQRTLPATATQAEVEAVVDEQTAPTPTAPASSCSSRPVSTTTRSSRGSTRTRTSTASRRSTSAGSSSASPRRCRARRWASSSCRRRYDIPLNGAEVVVIGRGLTVGRPLGLILTRRSENSTVTLCHTGTRDLAEHTRRADIVVAAAGVPGILKPDMVKPGAAVFDVGVSRVSRPRTASRSSAPATSTPARVGGQPAR